MKFRHLALLTCSVHTLTGQINPNQIQGPLEADSDTTYFVYVPKDLNAELKSPVMIWTEPDGSDLKTLEPFREAADTLGMIIATPVEARFEGALTLLNNRTHVSDVLDQLKKDFRINPDSVHFGGEKSGGAAALNHSVCLKSSGTFTVSAYLTPEIPAPVCKGHHFMAGQSNSSHRYMTAWSSAKLCENGTHYLYEGTREMPSSLDITVGMIWMYAQSLYEDSGLRADEVREFERRMRPWIKELVTNSPNEAAFVLKTLAEDCDPKGNFKNGIESLQATLARDPKTVAHVSGLEALDDFSENDLARYGNHYTPLTNHTTKRLEAAVGKIAGKHKEANQLQPVFKAVAEPTHP